MKEKSHWAAEEPLGNGRAAGQRKSNLTREEQLGKGRAIWQWKSHWAISLYHVPYQELKVTRLSVTLAYSAHLHVLLCVCVYLCLKTKKEEGTTVREEYN